MATAQKTRTRPQSRMKAAQTSAAALVDGIGAATAGVVASTAISAVKQVQNQAQARTQAQAQTHVHGQKQKQQQLAVPAQSQRQIELVDSARVSPAQSQALVKTFLEATVGTVAYLRGLLPEENFADYTFAPPVPVLPSGGASQRVPDLQVPGTQASQTSQSQVPASQAGGRLQGNAGQGPVRGLKIKKVTRGYSTEADKLLDWMDDGVMDAIGKRCLKSMIFGIYLDNDDPTNMCETYTCNFHYHRVASDDSAVGLDGADARAEGTKGGAERRTAFVPSMTVHEGIAGLDIGGTGGGEHMKTVADVKRSLRRLIKGLIVTCQQLAELPSRKWVSMKLIYMDGTPSSYEPEHFRPVTAADREWHFGTAGPDVKGDRYHIGASDDNHLGLNLKVISVVGDIPRPVQPETQLQDLQGAAMQSAANLLKRHREEEDAVQRESAAKRKYLWNVVDTAKDRMDIEPDAQGVVRAYGRNDSIGPAAPFAVRQRDGTLAPLVPEATVAQRQMDVKATIGLTLNVPPSGAELAKTYETGATGERDEDGDIKMTEDDIDQTQQANVEAQRQPQAHPPGPETQLAVFPATLGREEPESIESFSQDKQAKIKAEKDEAVQLRSRASTKQQARDKASDPKVECPCGCKKDADGYSWVVCDECDVWSHVVCLGYMDEGCLGSWFTCPSCVKRAENPTKSEMDVFAANLHDLALFRLALFTARKSGRIMGAKEFGNALGVNSVDAAHVIQRLEREGFVEPAQSAPRRSKTAVKKTWRYIQDNDAKVAEYLVMPGKVSSKSPSAVPAAPLTVANKPSDPPAETESIGKQPRETTPQSQEKTAAEKTQTTADVDMEVTKAHMEPPKKTHVASVTIGNIDVSSI